MAKANDETVIIFRRYRKGPNGQLLDARAYGYKAWPIRVPKKKRKDS